MYSRVCQSQVGLIFLAPDSTQGPVTYVVEPVGAKTISLQYFSQGWSECSTCENCLPRVVSLCRRQFGTDSLVCPLYYPYM